ncbi:MAG: DUF1801 domain-containing protein [Armatimonadetes bacterium]|nr:DUF1801 domain-containing protein [Armatimonadota bacterium]
MPKPESVDAYFDSIQWTEGKEALTILRQQIKLLAPDAIEVISYSMPAFKLGKNILYYAAFKNHLSLFPAMDFDYLLPKLEGYKISKGTIQFSPSKPIPGDVLKEIVLAKFARH